MKSNELTRIERFAAEAMKSLIKVHFPSDYCPVHISFHAFRIAQEMEELAAAYERKQGQ